MATKEATALEQARRNYAASKATSLGPQLQENSVAKFEVDHLSEQRKVYVKKGGLLYLVPRREAKARLEATERELGEKLAAMEKMASGSK